MPELPFPLSWSPAPESWAYKEGVLTVAAGPRTDLFTSPEDGSVRAEAPLLLGSYRGDFQFSALVAPAFGAAFQVCQRQIGHHHPQGRAELDGRKVADALARTHRRSKRPRQHD